MDEQTLAKVTHLLKTGDRAQAEIVLKDTLRKNPRDDQAWLWVTQVLTNDKQRLECVNRALEINPNNAQAQQYRKLLLERLNSEKDAAAPKTESALKPTAPLPAPPLAPPAESIAERISKYNLPPTQPLRAIPPTIEPEREANEEALFEPLPDAVNEQLESIASSAPTRPLVEEPATSPVAPPPVTTLPPAVEPPPVVASPPPAAVQPASSTTPPASVPPFASPVAPAPVGERFESLRVPPPPSPPPRRVTNNIAIIGFTFVGLILVGAALFAVYLFTLGPFQPTPPPTQVVVLPTNTVLVAFPTLPPAWTATFTPTATITATPRPTATATPAPASTTVFETETIAYQRVTGSLSSLYVTDGRGNGTSLTAQDSVDGNPAWSPDGQQIAFDSVRDPALADIYVINVDGTGETQLTTDAASDTQPVWSPDGQLIAFVSDREGDQDLYVMNVDGSDQRPLSSVRGVNETDPAWSPDGTQLAFTYSECATTETPTGPEAEQCHAEVYVLNIDGSGLKQLTLGGTLGSAQPAWSPDGVVIAFVSDVYLETASARQLVLINVDGSQARPLDVPNLLGMSQPAWSPDGLQIVFVATSDLSGEPEQGIFIVPLTCFDSPGPCTLADLGRIAISGVAAHPAWRPEP